MTAPEDQNGLREALADKALRKEVRDCIGETIPLRRRWVSALMAGPIARLIAERDALSYRRRWNVEERDGDVVAICHGNHDRSDDCDWIEYVPLARARAAEAELARLKTERQLTDKRIRAQRASLRQAWGIIDKGQFSRAMQAHRRLLKNWIERTHAAKAERDAAVADMKAAEAQNDALHVKLASLAPHSSCACSYDQPGDVCAHHSPALRAAEAEITRLKEGMEALGAALKLAEDVMSRSPFSTMRVWPNGTGSQEGITTIRAALATLSPKEQP